jgi:POT family proton-dependent oligopeptide transporter
MCLSPVELSATTKLAPEAFAAQLMSLWLMSDAAAQGINAQLVGYYSARNEIAYFVGVGSVVVLVGIVFHMIAPRIHAAMLGVD